MTYSNKKMKCWRNDLLWKADKEILSLNIKLMLIHIVDRLYDAGV